MNIYISIEAIALHPKFMQTVLVSVVFIAMP